jgi:hypothetical protein
MFSASAPERGVSMDPSPEDRAAAGKPDGTAGATHEKAGKIDAIETGADACIERAMIGYQATISLWIYEGSTIWGKYSAMLVANSLITEGYRKPFSVSLLTGVSVPQ